MNGPLVLPRRKFLLGAAAIGILPVPAMSSQPRQLVEAITRWREHPATMVRELFKTEPYPWQEMVLEAFPHQQRMAMQACKGPGKTAVEAWLGWNFLLTRPQPKIAATSISGDNLRDNLWAEMAKWRQAAPLLSTLFEWTTTRIFARQFPETWWMSARTWPKTGDAQAQANTLAGLHADYILFILDESGAIPDSVMASAEAALSSCKEGHIVQAGNPTNLEGPLWRASKDRVDMLDADGKPGLWHVTEITGDPDDPKRSQNVSVQWARDQIKTYGRDNPWVLVNVFGKFPPSSINALISEAEVLAAMKRAYREWEYRDFPKIMAADVARQGDDASVIAKRQGPQMFNFIKRRNVPDGMAGASLTNREWNVFGADACFIDATGGFGFTWIDQLKMLGRAAIGVGFANEATQSDRFYNKRAEMAFEFVDWIKQGGALPPLGSEGSHELLQALTRTTYTFKGDRVILEDKALVKLKLGYSPDEFDSAIMTFAEPVSVARQRPGRINHSAMREPYDPFAEMNARGEAPLRGPSSPYNPFPGS